MADDLCSITGTSGHSLAWVLPIRIVVATTTTIKKDANEVLRTLEGDKDWDRFLKELAESYLTTRRERTREKLKGPLAGEFEDVRVKRWTKEYW